MSILEEIYKARLRILTTCTYDSELVVYLGHRDYESLRKESGYMRASNLASRLEDETVFGMKIVLVSRDHYLNVAVEQ